MHCQYGSDMPYTMSEERQTVAPGRADESAAEFESRIREQGEHRARLDRLMALLSGEEEANP